MQKQMSRSLPLRQARKQIPNGLLTGDFVDVDKPDKPVLLGRTLFSLLKVEAFGYLEVC
jgi:hypothetical protein